MICKLCTKSFYTKTHGEVCMECKIDNFYTVGDCIFCNQHLELDVQENICVHLLPGCYQINDSSDIKDFAMRTIVEYERRGLRVFQKQRVPKPRKLLNESNE